MTLPWRSCQIRWGHLEDASIETTDIAGVSLTFFVIRYFGGVQGVRQVRMPMGLLDLHVSKATALATRLRVQAQKSNTAKAVHTPIISPFESGKGFNAEQALDRYLAVREEERDHRPAGNGPTFGRKQLRSK